MSNSLPFVGWSERGRQRGEHSICSWQSRIPIGGVFWLLFTNNFRVATLDLSGMRDSGRREEYSAEMRATEINSVINDANLGKNTYVIGHSFGGLMTAKFAKKYGGKISGILIVDSQSGLPENTQSGNIRDSNGKRYYSILLPQ